MPKKEDEPISYKIETTVATPAMLKRLVGDNSPDEEELARIEAKRAAEAAKVLAAKKAEEEKKAAEAAKALAIQKAEEERKAAEAKKAEEEQKAMEAKKAEEEQKALEAQ